VFSCAHCVYQKSHNPTREGINSPRLAMGNLRISGGVVGQAGCLSGFFVFPARKKSFWHESISTCFGCFSEIHAEKLFDICPDSTPIEEGLTGVTV
jgi:hypothetical protein